MADQTGRCDDGVIFGGIRDDCDCECGFALQWNVNVNTIKFWILKKWFFMFSDNRISGHPNYFKIIIHIRISEFSGISGPERRISKSDFWIQIFFNTHIHQLNITSSHHNSLYVKHLSILDKYLHVPAVVDRATNTVAVLPLVQHQN